MVLKTIRDVDERTWSQLKSLAAEHRVTLGILLKMMVENYKRKSSESWDQILNGKKTLSESEATILEKTTKELRKEKGWRI